MNKFLLLIFFTFSIVSAQAEWTRWEAMEVSYELPAPESRDYSIDNSGFGITIISSLQKSYYFLISDLDGDNCPFHPSCSAFFVQSVKETNIFTGALMFADRFTRDANFLKNPVQYPKHISGRLYDPPRNYTLNQSKIKIIPSSKIVK